MRAFPLLASLGFLGLGACAEAPASADRPARVQHAVINGTPDAAETGVVAISHLDHPMLCSGTVIGPTLVVTAKHCAFKEKSGGPDQPLAGDRFRVGFGPSTGSLTYRGTTKMEWIGQPASLEVQPAVEAGEDVALLWLSSAVPPGTFIHKVKTDYVPSSTDTFTIVGYGRSSLSSAASGVKLMTVDALVAVNGSTGVVKTQGKGACSGDSGGAFFFGGFPAGTQRELVGITSTAQKSDAGVECAVGISNATSVRNPKVSKLLLDALGIVGVCVPSAEVCGDGKDQDCDGIADNQCKADGQPCASEVECASGQCEQTGTGKTCVRLCGAKQTCPAGSHCVASCGVGWCQPGAPGKKKILEACSSGTDCETDHCGAVGCTFPCNPALGQCPDDMACAASTGCGECAALASVAGPMRLGEKCASTADCEADASCEDDGLGVLRCSRACAEGGGCPLGFVCHAGRCMRGGGLGTGERCMGAEHCASGACLTFPDRRDNFCTKGCDPSVGCAYGFECQKVAGQDLCAPTARRLGETCSTDDECISGHCNALLGACSRACSPSSAPCPPGFECKVVGLGLFCADATTWSPPSGGNGGGAGSGGAETGGAAPGGGAPSGGGAPGGGAKSQSSGSDSGGCSASRDGRPAGVLVALALLALAWQRRRWCA